MFRHVPKARCTGITGDRSACVNAAGMKTMSEEAMGFFAVGARFPTAGD